MSRTLGAVLILVCGGLLSACEGELPDETSSEPGTGAETTDDSNTSVEDVGVDSKAQVRTGNFVTGYHFVQISTHGSPRWSAYVDEFRDDNGDRINSHSVSTRSGGKVNLWFCAYPGTHYHVHVWEATVGNYEWWSKDTTVDQCFQVQAFGGIRYTGNSYSGGCDSH